MVPFGIQACGVVAGTCEPVPGTVGVSGQAAVGAGGTVQPTLVHTNLCYTQLRAHVQLLLWRYKHTAVNSFVTCDESHYVQITTLA